MLFRTECPGTPLPPEPILTRLRTWMCAASYYCTYSKEVHGVFATTIDSSAAVSIKKAKLLYSENSLEPNLVSIRARYAIFTIDDNATRRSQCFIN